MGFEEGFVSSFYIVFYSVRFRLFCFLVVVDFELYTLGEEVSSLVNFSIGFVGLWIFLSGFVFY